jgi:hypothetical protein
MPRNASPASCPAAPCVPWLPCTSSRRPRSLPSRDSHFTNDRGGRGHGQDDAARRRGLSDRAVDAGTHRQCRRASPRSLTEWTRSNRSCSAYQRTCRLSSGRRPALAPRIHGFGRVYLARPSSMAVCSFWGAREQVQVHTPFGAPGGHSGTARL